MVTKQMIALALSAYLDWVSKGAEEGGVFCRGSALCCNVHHHLIRVQDSSIRSHQIIGMMGDLFKADGLHPSFPFGGIELYDHEGDNESYHLNIDRLEWARSFVQRYAK